MGNYVSKFKWALRVQILSHTLMIWQKWITFVDVQMMLLGLFTISIGFRFRKITQEFSFQVLQCSWDTLTFTVSRKPNGSCLPYRLEYNPSLKQNPTPLEIMLTANLYVIFMLQSLVKNQEQKIKPQGCIQINTVVYFK